MVFCAFVALNLPSKGTRSSREFSILDRALLTPQATRGMTRRVGVASTRQPSTYILSLDHDIYTTVGFYWMRGSHVSRGTARILGGILQEEPSEKHCEVRRPRSGPSYLKRMKDLIKTRVRKGRARKRPPRRERDARRLKHDHVTPTRQACVECSLHKYFQCFSVCAPCLLNSILGQDYRWAYHYSSLLGAALGNVDSAMLYKALTASQTHVNGLEGQHHFPVLRNDDRVSDSL